MTCITTLRGNTLYVEPSESTGLKNTISNSYSLFSDLPLNVSVSSFRLMVASLSTSASSVFLYGIKDSINMKG